MKSTTPVPTPTPTPTSTTDGAGDPASDSGQTSTTELPSLAVPGPPDDLSTLLPQLIVHGDDADLELRAVTFCWSDDEVAGACADGVRPNPLPDAGRFPASIAFTFPRDDWQFEARVGAPGGPGGPAVVSMTESQDWTIDLPDRTGPSVVELFGEGPEGDYYVIFTADLGPMGG
jgi:hypothetical protein